jgi:hypothetical protein
MRIAISFLFIVVVIMNSRLGRAQEKGFNNNKGGHYDGDYFSGTGDTEYLALLDSAYMMTQPNAGLENLSMLYTSEWNGFVEGPTWDAWWIQNSFGPTYTMLPFMNKAYQTFVYNSQAMWFDHIGNGVRKGKLGFIAPEGSLCDCASPDLVVYRQGDGKVQQHDWAFGFAAAGVIMQSELLLISRNKVDIEHYLPLLEKTVAFIDSRRDPVNNMFLVGPAANLLAPSFAGTGKLLADGSYGRAYLAEISINYIAALDRIIELEKMMDRKAKVLLYSHRITLIKKGLSNFITPKGYFVRSIDPDGTKHGVYGAPVHGYFAASPNCDAIAFRIANDRQAKDIYKMIASLPELRPYKLIIPNYPAYDDMYQYNSIFQYGTWVNGGEWATLEARAQLGYYRVGAYHDAEEAFQQILERALNFRLDNPLTHFGSKEYQPDKPINCVYDCWGVPGGFLRGLFEYIYTAKGLRLYPHIPPGITALQQKFPVYFGKKKIYISVKGTGDISTVMVNGRPVTDFTKGSLFLSLDAAPGTVYVSVGLGGSPAKSDAMNADYDHKMKPVALSNKDYWNIDLLRDAADTTFEATPEPVVNDIKKVSLFYAALEKKKLEDTYEAQHAVLILEMVKAIHERRKLKEQKRLQSLPEQSQAAADNLYISTVKNLTEGLVHHLESCKGSSNKNRREMYFIWSNAG